MVFRTEKKPLELDSGNTDARNKPASKGISPQKFSPEVLNIIYLFDPQLLFMNVYLNSRSYPLKDNTDLMSFLEEIKIDITRGIAVAVNNIVVPKSAWNKTTLNDNDKITLIKASAGG